MVEAEIKFRLNDDQRLEKALRERFGAEFGPPQTENDLYFQHNVRNFQQTDEALRLWQIGRQLWVTYKGPKLDQTTKSREEIELPLGNFVEKTKKNREISSDSEALAEKNVEEQLERWTTLFVRLGFRPVAPVVKTRRKACFSFENRPVELTWDHLDDLGDFVEIEMMIENSAELESARKTLLALAEILGLSGGIRESYLELLLRKRENSQNL